MMIKIETLNLNLGEGLIKVTFVRCCAKLCYFYFILIGWLKKRGCKRVSERGANSHAYKTVAGQPSGLYQTPQKGKQI